VKEREKEQEEKEEKGISETASKAACYMTGQAEGGQKVRTRARIAGNDTDSWFTDEYSDVNGWNYTTSTATVDYK
jgi:hypothetical protein